MRIAVSHALGRDEVRRRLASRSDEIANFIPGGMADVTTSWPSENRMNLKIHAIGQDLTGAIDVEETQLVFTIDLPPALSFLEPMIQSAIESRTRKLLG